MHFCSLVTLVLTVTIRSITLATPIVEHHVRPRNHVECDTAQQLCKIQQTCANAPSIVAGTVPKPWPSTVPTLVNPVPALASLTSGASAGSTTSPVPALASLTSGASAGSTTSKQRDRRANAVTWCGLGTEIYILLAVQGTQGAVEIQGTLGTAIQQLQTQMNMQNATDSEMGIAAGSEPVFILAGVNTKLTAYNVGGLNMTWIELEVGLLTIADWMDSNTYGWGSASIWDGSNEVGLVYITV